MSRDLQSSDLDPLNVVVFLLASVVAMTLMDIKRESLIIVCYLKKQANIDSRSARGKNASLTDKIQTKSRND